MPEIQSRSCNDVTDTQNSVAIVGGGIAGLTTALALAQSDIRCVVFEQHVEKEDIGAGIQLPPNATRLLGNLGLLPALKRIGSVPVEMIWLDGRDDAHLARFKMGDSIGEEFGAPYLQLHRPQLMQLLVSALRQEPMVDLRFDSPVCDIASESDSVVLKVNGQDESADVCVVAEGTNSSIRRRLGYETRLKRRHYGTAYRVVLTSESAGGWLLKPITRIWLHERFHVVVYPIHESQMVNCVFVVRNTLNTTTEDLHRATSDLLELKHDIGECSRELESLMRACQNHLVYKWPISAFEPFAETSSTQQRVVFVGDAWHTALPYAAQGAAMAIEDGYEIGRLLGQVKGDFTSGVKQKFERCRLDRIRRVHAISRRNDTIYHMGSTFLRWLRNRAAPLGFRMTAKQLYSN